MSGAEFGLRRGPSREVRWTHVTDRARTSQVSQAIMTVLWGLIVVLFNEVSNAYVITNHVGKNKIELSSGEKHGNELQMCFSP